LSDSGGRIVGLEGLDLPKAAAVWFGTHLSDA